MRKVRKYIENEIANLYKPNGVYSHYAQTDKNIIEARCLDIIMKSEYQLRRVNDQRGFWERDNVDKLKFDV